MSTQLADERTKILACYFNTDLQYIYNVLAIIDYASLLFAEMST